MSKTKTKRARREAKRSEARKATTQHRKAALPTSKPSTAPAQPPTKKHKPSTKSSNDAATVKPHVQASQKHEVPFGVYDNILLVGEGDFSFTRSLVLEHGCANVTATSYDSEEEVRSKYSYFAATHEELTALTPPVPFHHSIDAAKLSGYKSLRGGEPWDTIAFMFPHTGGLSTDVNRQVRANQSLLVSFFRSCLETSSENQKNKDKSNSSSDKKSSKAPFLRPGGQVIVCLFEGAPYTLWNVRDLGRHAGLKVVKSEKFDWAAYPGYAHVRTLGTIEGGGAWKGEDRDVRMYIFEKAPEEEGDVESSKKKRKVKGRKREREESESSDDEERV